VVGLVSPEANPTWATTTAPPLPSSPPHVGGAPKGGFGRPPTRGLAAELALDAARGAHELAWVDLLAAPGEGIGLPHPDHMTDEQRAIHHPPRPRTTSKVAARLLAEDKAKKVGGTVLFVVDPHHAVGAAPAPSGRGTDLGQATEDSADETTVDQPPSSWVAAFCAEAPPHPSSSTSPTAERSRYPSSSTSLLAEYTHCGLDRRSKKF
jgi:hypothetical protein